MLKHVSPEIMGLRGRRRAFPIEGDTRTGYKFREGERLHILERLLRGVGEFQAQGATAHIDAQNITIGSKG